MRVKFFFGFVLSFFVSCNAQAISGNDLQERFAAPETTWREGFAWGYVLGAVATLSDSDVRYLCIPGGVTNEQIVAIVKKYLDGNPEWRHLPAHQIVYIALKNWQCKVNKKR